MGGDRLRREVGRYLPAVLLVAILPPLLALLLSLARGDRIMGRVYVDGLDVSGWARSRLATALRARADGYLTRPVTIRWDARSWRLEPGEAGLSIDWRGAAAEALGGSGWLGARLLGAAGTILRPRRITLTLCISQTRLAAVLRDMAGPAVERPPRNAVYDLVSGKTIPGQSGWRIDAAATGRRLCRAARTNRRAGLVLQEVAPATSVRDLAKLRLDRTLASFSTGLSGSSPDRLANIRLGAAQLNGILVRPGGVFSFNTATGPRNAANGYRPALEIVRMELVPGIGGGICQVATTLYNAALLAGLPIVERSCHALPPGYVPLGRDATVHYPVLDLRFANTTAGHLMILAAVAGDTLRVRLIGECPRAGPVWVVSRVLARLEPPLVEPGDPRATRNKAGAPGYRVRVTRIFGDPERPARIEVVSEDVYHPVARVAGEAGADRPPRTEGAGTGAAAGTSPPLVPAARVEPVA